MQVRRMGMVIHFFLSVLTGTNPPFDLFEAGRNAEYSVALDF